MQEKKEFANNRVSQTGKGLSRNQVRAPNKSGWENQGHAKADENQKEYLGCKVKIWNLKRQTPNAISILNKSKARNQPRVHLDHHKNRV